MDARGMTGDELKAVLRDAAVRMQSEHVKEVRDLDAEIGDGDLGITVQKGFRAVEEYLAGTSDSELSQILKQVGLEFNEANPSTFSAFFSTAFRKAGVAIREKQIVAAEDLCAMLQAAVQGVVKLGKASATRTGRDKTAAAARHLEKVA